MTPVPSPTASLDRIERALSVLEGARPIATDEGLAERHRRLREAVTDALGTLDGLLAGNGNG